MPKKAVYSLIFFIVLSVFPASLTAADGPHPFSPGERLTYKIRWGFLPAGTAEFLVQPMETIQGVAAHHFSLTAKTSSLVEVFYKFQMAVSTYMDSARKRSLHYEETHTKRKTTRTSQIRFDWETGTAQYVVNDRKNSPINIQPGALDWFSAFYYLRTVDLNAVTGFTTPVTDGRQCVIGRAVVAEKEEEVTLDDATYNTRRLKLSANGHVGTLFKKEKKMEVIAWVTNDDRRIPVRLKSKLAFGSVVADLVSVDTEPQSPTAAAQALSLEAPDAAPETSTLTL